MKDYGYLGLFFQSELSKYILYELNLNELKFSEPSKLSLIPTS